MATSASTISSASANSRVQTQFSIADLFNRNPKQIEAWIAQTKHRFLLYGGQAGGGKSFFLRWWAVAYLIDLAEQGVPKATVGLFCENYPSLRDRQIAKIEMEFPESLGKLRQGDTRDFVLNDQFGGGRIMLRNLDDPSKYLSAEFAGIAVDELTRNDVDTFEFLRMRLRWPGVARPRFVGASNPGGRGHGWVKAFWINKEFPKQLEPLKDEFTFVRAKASDNPCLTQSYHDDLQTLKPELAKMYAEGSWDVFAGQYFSNFSLIHHTHEPQEIELKPWWPRWISIDWGFHHPAAVYWHAKDGDRIITYREIWGAGVGESELAQRIVEASLADCDANGKPIPIQDIFIGKDAFAKRGSANTVAEQISDVLFEAGMPRLAPADDDRVGGARLMYELLQANLWTVSTHCEKLIKCLPSMIHDEKKVEDVLKVDASEGQLGDDPYDAARYGLKSMLAEGRLPLEQRIEAKIHASDPTSIMILRAKYAAEERKKMQPVFRPSRFRHKQYN